MELLSGFPKASSADYTNTLDKASKLNTVNSTLHPATRHDARSTKTTLALKDALTAGIKMWFPANQDAQLGMSPPSNLPHPSPVIDGEE